MRLTPIFNSQEQKEPMGKDTKKLFSLLKAYGAYKDNYTRHIVFSPESKTLGEDITVKSLFINEFF